MHILEAVKNYFGVNKDDFNAYTSLNFFYIDKKAKELANLIVEKKEELIDILLKYESFEVVEDEIERTLDLLNNLKENEEYFKIRVGEVTTFLPRNQPLYAFSCFVIIPSLMSSQVHFRIPHTMKVFFPEILALLEIDKRYPNIVISHKERLDFLRDRSALLINPLTKTTKPKTEVVIFTGTSAHAEQLRIVFDQRTLFIANGSGHNPIIIASDANILEAAQAVIDVQFYNQGQDCAAPNSILIHKDICESFLNLLRRKVLEIKVGPYTDKSCRVGPNGDLTTLVKTQDFLVENRQWIDISTPGVIISKDAIIMPTIICKPLSFGGNFTETFAPIVFLQEYENDNSLKEYFEKPEYANNAMYISLYGNSMYVSGLIDRSVNGKVLHRKSTFKHNTHLHVKGVERGTEVYGGYGAYASSYSISGMVYSVPTLPQRDIYEQVAKQGMFKDWVNYTEIQYKNVEKLLRLVSKKENEAEEFLHKRDDLYVDLQSLVNRKEKLRYVKVESNEVWRLLLTPNAKQISKLTAEEIGLIKKLNLILLDKASLKYEDFRNSLYAIPKLEGLDEGQNKIRQSAFFKNIYELLFAEKSGPQLASFLLDVKPEKIQHLLDV